MSQNTWARVWALGLILVLLGACTSMPHEVSESEVPSPFEDGPSTRPLQPLPTEKPDWGMSPPPGKGMERYTDQQITWAPCGTVDCGFVLVPMDYQEPDGWAIQLRLSRRPSSEAKPAATLFLNPGGPGLSGTAELQQIDDPDLAPFHLISWDPRGTIGSAPVACPGVDVSALVTLDRSPDTPAEDRAWLDLNREFGRSCLKGTGSLLQHVSTEETVRDLELLRQVVGEPRLSFIGSSYGSLIGALYAEMYPKRVGRMVLDGAVPLGTEPSVGWVHGFELALEEFAGWCVDWGEQCRLGSTPGEVLTTVRDLLAGLDAKPMKAGLDHLTQSAGVDAVINAMYGNKESWLELQGALEQAVLDGDGLALLGMAHSWIASDQQMFTSSWAILCLDQTGPDLPGARRAAAEDARQSPTLGPAYGLDATCAMWPVPPRPLPFIDGAGAAPILVIGTRHDPATTHDNAVRMSGQLESGVLLTFEGYGHGALWQSACAHDLAIEYLSTGKPPADGTRCD